MAVIGKNDPCPCRSGRKFEKCHGDPTKNWAAFWTDLEPRLKAHLDGIRDHDAEFILRCSIGFASFHLENCDSQISENREAALQLAPLAMQNLDILRGLLAGLEIVSIVSMSALARIAFETHVNLRWILTRPAVDVPVFARRYAEYFHVERLLYEQKKSRSKAGQAACLKEIQKNWPAWVGENGKVIKHWTALEVGRGKPMTLGRMCIQIDQAIAARRQALDPTRKPTSLGPDDLPCAGELESDYNVLYALASKPVHAAPTIRNLFLTGSSFGPLASPENCAMFALLGARYCNRSLDLVPCLL